MLYTRFIKTKASSFNDKNVITSPKKNIYENDSKIISIDKKFYSKEI